MSESVAVLVAGHGPLPEALVSSARMVGGDLSAVRWISLMPNDTPLVFAARLREELAIHRPDVILSDLAGGTPHNTARLVLREWEGIPLVSAASLGLLLELALADAVPEDLGTICSATNPTIVIPSA